VGGTIVLVLGSGVIVTGEGGPPGVPPMDGVTVTGVVDAEVALSGAVGAAAGLAGSGAVLVPTTLPNVVPPVLEPLTSADRDLWKTPASTPVTAVIATTNTARAAAT